MRSIQVAFAALSMSLAVAAARPAYASVTAVVQDNEVCGGSYQCGTFDAPGGSSVSNPTPISVGSVPGPHPAIDQIGNPSSADLGFPAFWEFHFAGGNGAGAPAPWTSKRSLRLGFRTAFF